MLKNKSPSDSRGLIYILIFIGVPLIAILFLLNIQNDDTSEMTDVFNETVFQNDAGNIEVDDAVDMDGQTFSVDLPSSSTDILPADRDQLVSEQTINLDPYNCQTDGDSAVVNSDMETEKCLADNSEEEAEQVDEEVEVSPPQPASFALGQPFNFTHRGYKLEIITNSFQCRTIGDIVTKLGDGNSLSVILDDFYLYKDLYKDGTPSLSQLLAFDNLGAFGYIDNFEKHLDKHQLKLASDDLIEYFSQYKECSLQLVAKNIGEDSYLPDSCGLSFSRSVSLLDSQGRAYRFLTLSGMQLSCLKAIIDFPINAKDKDTVYFVLPSEAQAEAVVFQNRSAPSEKTVVRLEKKN